MSRNARPWQGFLNFAPNEFGNGGAYANKNKSSKKNKKTYSKGKINKNPQKDYA